MSSNARQEEEATKEEGPSKRERGDPREGIMVSLTLHMMRWHNQVAWIRKKQRHQQVTQGRVQHMRVEPARVHAEHLWLAV
jgi:hypothetical protein